MKKSKHQYAVEFVSDSSVPPHLSGFIFLSEAVVLKSENYAIKLVDIYKSIAKNHRCTHRAIARSIAYAISQAEHIHEYLSISKNNLFNGKVIAMLALKLKSIFEKIKEL